MLCLGPLSVISYHFLLSGWERVLMLYYLLFFFFFLLPSTKHVDFVTDNNCSCAFWCAMGWMLQILRKVTCIREVLICLYAENFVWEILRSVFTLDNLTFFKIRNSPFKNVYFFMWNWVIFLLEYVLCISFCQWNSLTWYSVNSPLFWKLSKSVIW